MFGCLKLCEIYILNILNQAPETSHKMDWLRLKPQKVLIVAVPPHFETLESHGLSWFMIIFIIFSWKLAILGCPHVWTNPYLSKPIYSKSFDDCSAASSPRICPTPCRSALDTSRRPLSAVLDPLGPVFQEFLAGSAGRIKSTPKSRSVSFWWFQSVCFKECLIYIAKHGMMTFGIFSQGELNGISSPPFLQIMRVTQFAKKIKKLQCKLRVQKKKHMCPPMSQCLNSFCQPSSFDCF